MGNLGVAVDRQGSAIEEDAAAVGRWDGFATVTTRDVVVPLLAARIFFRLAPAH